MATDAQVAHYTALAAEAIAFFGIDPDRQRNANQQALMIASYRRMKARRDAMPAPVPVVYPPTFAYDFDDDFEHVPLERFLRIHADDEVLCAWARTAQLGERRSGVQRVL